MQLDLRPQLLPLADVAIGNVRVGGTRVTLDTIVARFRQEFSPEAIASSFPTVGLSTIYAVIAYYLARRAKVEAYLAQQHEEEAASCSRAPGARPTSTSP